METLQTAEIQGPYGSLSIPEQVLQQIWHEGKYMMDQLFTVSGKRLDVRCPGVWNHNEGPDFLNARFRFDGEPVAGDVEVHFHLRDWRLHRHDQDPGFNRVVLHVVLFPGAQLVQTQHGSFPEALVLLPHLEMDMEQYLLDFRLARMERAVEMPLRGNLMPAGASAFLAHLADAAGDRWKSKRDMLQIRLEASGWTETCHQTLMEGLGGRRNRATFSRLALRFPLARMQELTLSSEQLFEETLGEWKLAGLRPSNHPLLRLEQYLYLVKQIPQWPEILASVGIRASQCEFKPADTSLFRRTHRMGAVCSSLYMDAFAGAFPAGMFKTLCSDVLIPMIAAQTGANLFDWWYHWHPGNFPESLSRFLRQQCTERGLHAPLGNGLQQGLLKLLDDLRDKS